MRKPRKHSVHLKHKVTPDNLPGGSWTWENWLRIKLSKEIGPRCPENDQLWEQAIIQWEHRYRCLSKVLKTWEKRMAQRRSQIREGQEALRPEDRRAWIRDIFRCLWG